MDKLFRMIYILAALFFHSRVITISKNHLFLCCDMAHLCIIMIIDAVFNQWNYLYTCIAGDHGHSISPVTPSELLIALHNIDCSHDEALMKAAIKGCFFSSCVIMSIMHSFCSDKYLLFWEECVHTGSVGCGSAAATRPLPYSCALHENSNCIYLRISMFSVASTDGYRFVLWIWCMRSIH